jgi:hypothetical protein
MRLSNVSVQVAYSGPANGDGAPLHGQAPGLLVPVAVAPGSVHLVPALGALAAQKLGHLFLQHPLYELLHLPADPSLQGRPLRTCWHILVFSSILLHGDVSFPPVSRHAVQAREGYVALGLFTHRLMVALGHKPGGGARGCAPGVASNRVRLEEIP